VQYEWNHNKAQANLAKHEVYFSVTEEFDWTTAIETYDDRSDYGETRWIA